MANRSYHVFFSYARADNLEDNNHFISRFHDLLCKQHQYVTGRELETFFDTASIDGGEHWQTRLRQGLRESKLFLAFLSDNYLKSEVCRWEWEHYLLTEHAAARGEDGIVPLYFIPIKNLQKQNADEQIAAWVKEISRRNLGQYCELQPWYKAGGNRLRELDAAERSGALRDVDASSETDITLSERIRRLNLLICKRLDRISLADSVIGNIVRQQRHFVGRHKQLCELHRILTGDERGLLATPNSTGGLGKSALARQYAVAYADFYAAGGIWELHCAGEKKLGNVLLQLEKYNELLSIKVVDRPDGGDKDQRLTFNFKENRDQDPDTIAENAFSQLRGITTARRQIVEQQLRGSDERRTPEDALESYQNSGCLLILDNVDEPELLDACQLKLIPDQGWLSVIVTTRLAPRRFGAISNMRGIDVPPLSGPEGVELLRTFMRNGDFPNAEEEKAAEELVSALDGYTIALELVGAYLASTVDGGEPVSIATYLDILRHRGVTVNDELAEEVDVAAQVPYQHKQVGGILADTVSRLKTTLTAKNRESMAEAAVQILEIASLLQPDRIPEEWLQGILQQVQPDLEGNRRGMGPWQIIRRALVQHRLLSEVEGESGCQARDKLLRIHRLIAEHVGNQIEGKDWHWVQIERYLEPLGKLLREESTFGTLEARNLCVERILGQARHLLTQHPVADVVGTVRLAVDHEGRHGSLARALALAEEIGALKDVEANQPALHASALVTLGRLYSRREKPGDTKKALSCYQKALEHRQLLYKRNSESTEAARDLSKSYIVLGDLYQNRRDPGDVKAALVCFQKAHELRQALHERNPESTEATRDLSESYIVLGDLYQNRSETGDEETALSCFQKAHELSQTLYERNPDSPEAMRELSISYNRLGDFHQNRGEPCDGKTTLAYFQRSQELNQALYERNPDSTEAARELLISYGRLGDSYHSRGQPGDEETALCCFKKAHELIPAFYERNPDIAEAVRGFAISYRLLGDFYQNRRELGDWGMSVFYYEKVNELNQLLHERNPDSGEAARDLSASYECLGALYRDGGDPNDWDKALSCFEKVHEVNHALYERDPASAKAARELSLSYRLIGELYEDRSYPGDGEKALFYFQKSDELN